MTMRMKGVGSPIVGECKLKTTVGFALLGLALCAQVSSYADAGQLDLALRMPFVSSDPNVSGWNAGLTDGSWELDAGKTFATGASDKYPKDVTVDLGGRLHP